MVRKSHQILPQILNRLRERKVVDRQNRKSVRGMKKECCTNPTFIEFRGYKSYCEVYLDEFCIKTKTGDNCVSIHGNVALVRNLVRSDADDWVIYEKFSSLEPFFVEPLCSADLSVQKVSKLDGILRKTKLSAVNHKYVMLPFGHLSWVAIPLLHVG